MDLNAIAVFVKVVEAGSFVGAARTAEIPKSTIARRIDELEDALGVRLLQRSTRQLSLTDAGRSFYERCRAIMDEIHDATASVSEHQSEPRGRLRFTTSVLMGETFLGKWAGEFLLRFPKVELEMYLAARKVDLLAEGFDLAVRVGKLESSTHIVRRLAPAPQHLCASPGYLEDRGTPEVTDDLRNHDCVIFSPDRVRLPWELENEKGDSVSISVPGRLIVNSFPVALDACLAGHGIAQLPAFLCCDPIRSGALVRVLPQWDKATRWLHALYPSRHHLSATVRTFLDFITEKLTPAPWILD